MAARTRKTPERDPNDPTLSQILQDDSNSIGISYADIDSLSILRLTYCVSVLGGMVTFWNDRVNKRVCFSMRLWGEARSYNSDTASQFSQVSEPIVEKLSKVIAGKKLPPPPPLKPIQLVPKSDK